MENCHKMYLYCVISKLVWYSKGLNFTNRISIFNHEFVFEPLIYYWHPISKRYFKTKINSIFHKQGVSFIPPNWVRGHRNFLHHKGCLHVSRNQRIEKCGRGVMIFIQSFGLLGFRLCNLLISCCQYICITCTFLKNNIWNYKFFCEIIYSNLD